MMGMQRLPSRDIAPPRITLEAGDPLANFTTKELKDALLERGCFDFSRWEVLVKLSPFLVIFAAVFLYKLKHLWDGTLLGCWLG
jgi:hypothetical protein